MLNYYYKIAPYILPYMKDRPQSLNRYPHGIKGESFYQKNVKGKVEDWITTHDYQNTTQEGEKTFLVCTDEATLLYMANLGCIEMHPWHSRVQSPENPDWCVIDLDPDNNSFEQVIEAAIAVKIVLDAIDVPSFPKTSGSTGMHIYIPLGAKYSYEQSKQLAHLIVSLVHPDIASFTSLERSPAKRKGKIYLDYLQNRAIQTIAAPYSLRPKPGATASAPLHWEEVKKGLDMHAFNIFTMPGRIKSEGDIFKPVLGKGIDLEKLLKKVESLDNQVLPDLRVKKLNRKNIIYTSKSGTTIYVNYSEELRRLEIQFIDGRTYQYIDVEPEEWERYKTWITSGKSAGEFANKFIKPGHEVVEI
jgi:bifunctional non-homologous end joining protein LigD